MADQTDASDEATLANLFERKQRVLERELAAARMIAHPTASGEATELNWTGLFQTMLPDRYSVRKATVVDSNGLKSDQIDIVVFDTQYSPLLIEFQNQCYIPAESVYAIFEVKQTLSKQTLQYAGEKAASVRRLERTTTGFPTARGDADPVKPFDIPAGILAAESSWEPPLGGTLEKNLQALAYDERLELGLALTDGLFLASSDAGESEVETLETEYTLPIFLLRFLDLLRGLATVPAMDFEAYLEAIPSNPSPDADSR